MARYKPKPFDHVVVTWEDCYTDAAAQYESGESMLKAYKPCMRRSHGIFIGRTDKVVAICTDDDGDGAVGGPSFIPAGIVHSIARPRRRR